LWAKRFDVLIANGTGGSHYWFQRFLSPQGWFVWHDHSDGLYRERIPDAFHPPKAGAYPKRVLRSVRRADLIITVTERGVPHLRDIQGVSSPIKVLPALVDVTAPVSQCQPFLPKKQVRFGYFGRLEPGKGIGALLESWSELYSEDTDIELHIYGPDPEHRYERRSLDLGLARSVHFHGPYRRDQLPALLRTIDAGLLTSLAEGCPMVALEYMANGLPFVMTDVGAARTLAANNPDVVLAPVSPEGVKSAIREMTKRIRTGTVSPDRLQRSYFANYSYDVLAQRYLALFRSLSPRT